MNKIFNIIFDLVTLFGIFSFAHLMERRDDFYAIYNLFHVLLVSMYGVIKYYDGKRDALKEKENESFTR